ncbi:MAG: hypothetical protein QOC62_3712 [Mycobacterium sp.]|nr:hypothetical protein [Mycobacterium sp.]
MWFFADGTEALICVHTNAPMGSKEFYDADAERFTARRGWGPLVTGLNLASEAINSGDYMPVSAEEAERVMAAMQQRIGEGR